MQESFLLESHIDEIYNLINENQSSFDNVWNLIKEKINNAVKGIKSKEEAVNYIINVYKKIKHFPEAIRNKTIKYVFALLIATFGLTTLMGALPDDIKKSSSEIISGKSLDAPAIQMHKTPIRASEEIKDFIKDEEGFSLKAYALGDGMVTIGWGHAEPSKHSKFKVGHVITQEKAQRLFDKDIKEAESGLNRILNDWKDDGIKVQINQSMYDAMVSMIFNMGIGNFRKSEFIQLVKNNKMSEARKKILTTNVNYEGIKDRREKESKMFGHGVLAMMMGPALREYIRREVSKLLTA